MHPGVVGMAGRAAMRLHVVMADLDAVRSGIDTIDDALVDLLARRQRLVEQAATFKRDAGEVRGEERRRLVMAMIDEFVALELRAHGGPHG